MHLDYTKVIILILWWRNFQLEYWRTFQLVSTKTNEVNKEISYETLLVTFGEGIGRLDTMFDDPQVWGVATLKQWIDGYETTRFTEIDDRTAVITSEYNMDSVKEWLQKNTPIINLEKR